jgi:hypothetical protein
MSSAFSLVVSGGPRLGDIESGAVAGAAGARLSVVSGGVLCVLGVAAVLATFAALLRYDADDVIASSTSRSPAVSRATASASESSSAPY